MDFPLELKVFVHNNEVNITHHLFPSGLVAQSQRAMVDHIRRS